MPFEDLLKPVIPCATCKFIANLPEPLQSEVRAAVAKPIYSDQTISNGMRQVQTEYNRAPGKEGVHNHRQRGHA